MLGLLTLAVGFAVKWVPDLAKAEYRVDEVLNRNHNAMLDGIALTINAIFSTPGVLATLVVAFVILGIGLRSPVNAIAVVSIAAVGWISSEIFKLIVSQPRPVQTLLPHPLIASDGSGSYPSGHTSFAIALAVACFFLARQTRWAPASVGIGVAGVLIVGASRLYLGAHYPSDLIGSVLATATALSIFSVLWNRHALPLLARSPLPGRLGPILPANTKQARSPDKPHAET